MGVKCYLSHYSKSWDIGLHSRERIKPHNTHTQHAHIHTYTQTYTHTHTLKESFIWGLELSYNVRTAPKIHLPTQIHTSERRGTSPLTVPVCTMPKSTTLSLFAPIQLCVQRLQRGWHYCSLHTQGHADVFPKQSPVLFGSWNKNRTEMNKSRHWCTICIMLTQNSPHLPGFSLGQQSGSDSRFNT